MEICDEPSGTVRLWTIVLIISWLSLTWNFYEYVLGFGEECCDRVDGIRAWSNQSCGREGPDPCRRLGFSSSQRIWLSWSCGLACLCRWPSRNRRLWRGSYVSRSGTFCPYGWTSTIRFVDPTRSYISLPIHLFKIKLIFCTYMHTLTRIFALKYLPIKYKNSYL